MGILKCAHCHTEFDAGEGIPDSVLKCPHCNGTVLPSETESELPPGFVLGGFEIVKLLGRGGMGNVYLATQVSMQRHVALKVLPKTLTRDGASVMKFLNEVKNSGRLQHAHVVAAIDAGEDNGVYFLAMQYVAGETLEAKIDRDKRIQEADALDYALMIADALKYAWDRQKIFHKDIKPGNIIIDNTSDEAFLLDMGISQKIGEVEESDGHIEGSPFYMSPEQSRGEKLDWRTDLYSLGATLYNAVTGVPPFDSKDLMRIVEMHTTEPFPDPARRAPEVKITPSVVKLMKRMMGKKPLDRYRSWSEFIKECRRVRKEIGGRTSKLKHMKARAGRVNQLKGSGGSRIMLFSFLSLIVIASIGGFFGYKMMNKAAAKKALERAEDYISRPGFSSQNAMDLFAGAKDYAERMGVSEDVRNRAVSGYAAMKSAEERRIAEVEAVGNALKTATSHFSKAKELHLQAKESLRLRQTDGGYLAKSMAEAKTALKGASGISSEDTKESQRITQFKDAVGILISQLESDIGRKNKTEAESAAKAGQMAEMAATQDKASKAQFDSYRKELTKRKQELAQIFVIAGKRREFEAAKERFVVPKEQAQGDAQSRREALLFNVWLAATTERIDRAAKVWSTISRSGNKFAGKLFTVNGKSCTLNSIDNGEITHSNGKTPISDLSPSDMLTLLTRTLPQEDAGQDMMAFLIADGDFEEAASFADADGRKEISFFAKSYIKARMQKALKDRAAGKPGGMERLSQEYGSMPEYSEVMKELDAAPK